MTIPEKHVSVRNLRKNYGAFVALDGVSFDIERGETFALLGPNGAGKSTTIEILEGYRDRSSGEVSVLGVDPQHGGLGWKARLGIVLQSSGESGNVTVREQLAHFARLYPNSHDVDEVIAAVGLTEKARTRIKALSGGQRRRVDVALGLIGRPELLFLDEPTTGFDPEARREFWELIRSLKRDGTTILLTSTRRPSSATGPGRSRRGSSSPSAGSTRSAGRMRGCRWCAGGTRTARTRSARPNRPLRSPGCTRERAPSRSASK
jgi:ABC-2 type transport system ATP-binding protein